MSDTDPALFICLGCNQPIEIPPESIGKLVVCPYCNHPFFASHELADQEIVDDTEDAPVQIPAGEQPELDSTRIHQIAAERRAAYRVRSYYIIGLIASVVIALQLILTVIDNLRQGVLNPKTAGYACFFIVMLMTGWFCYRKIREYRQQSIPGFPVQHETIPEPDFSKLGDGSERWKKLDEMTRNEEEA